MLNNYQIFSFSYSHSSASEPTKKECLIERLQERSDFVIKCGEISIKLTNLMVTKEINLKDY